MKLCLRNSGCGTWAALGASEVTDALVIAVSEERGTISVARKGHIRQNLTPIQLHAHLSKVLSLS
ncbi:MAG: diadenylate cyclase [Alistipes indistinctus]